MLKIVSIMKCLDIECIMAFKLQYSVSTLINGIKYFSQEKIHSSTSK